MSHPNIKDGWFREQSSSFSGQSFALKVDKILLNKKSEFQDILVFKSSTYGNVLVLDGIIQCTERDEFSYQEMIAHVPMFSHPLPRKILIIGGGDGGVLREILKHELEIDKVVLVEIDEYVINLSKKYFPKMASGLEHLKVEIVLQDGFEYLKQNKGMFDIIITDSSDPEGPAENFFQLDYFKLLNDSLTEDGITISQSSENIWLNILVIKQLLIESKKVFPNVKYFYTCTPSYTSGQLGLIISCKNKDIDLEKPQRSLPIQNFDYYNQQIHKSSFVLPTWARDYLK